MIPDLNRRNTTKHCGSRSAKGRKISRGLWLLSSWWLRKSDSGYRGSTSYWQWIIIFEGKVSHPVYCGEVTGLTSAIRQNPIMKVHPINFVSGLYHLYIRSWLITSQLSINYTIISIIYKIKRLTEKFIWRKLFASSRYIF